MHKCTRELEKVDQRLCSNKLSLNINKSLFMILNLSCIPNISIRSVPVKYVDCFKFLGIMVDNKLSYSNQIDNVCSKINRCIGIFKRLSSCIPLYILTKMYSSMVYLHLVYGVEVWGDGNKTNLKRLESSLNRFVSLLSGGSNCSENPYKYLNIFKSNQIYQHFSLI